MHIGAEIGLEGFPLLGKALDRGTPERGAHEKIHPMPVGGQGTGDFPDVDAHAPRIPPAERAQGVGMGADHGDTEGREPLMRRWRWSRGKGCVASLAHEQVVRRQAIGLSESSAMVTRYKGTSRPPSRNL